MMPSSGTNIGNIWSMKIAMVSIAGMLACASAIAQEGFAGLADPTRPASASRSYVEVIEPIPAGPVLQSTIVAPGIKRAVISGKTYTVGERLGAAVVADIRSYEVILDQDGRETRLRLIPPLAKETMGAPTGQMKGANP